MSNSLQPILTSALNGEQTAPRPSKPAVAQPVNKCAPITRTANRRLQHPKLCSLPHPHPHPERPAFISDFALDAGRGLCRVERIEEFRLFGVKRHGLAKAIGQMVKPSCTVMPDEGIVTGQIIAGRIDDFPGLGAVCAEADAIDHSGGRMVAAEFGEDAAAMILGGGEAFVEMTAQRFSPRPPSPRARPTQPHPAKRD